MEIGTYITYENNILKGCRDGKWCFGHSWERSELRVAVAGSGSRALASSELLDSARHPAVPQQMAWARRLAAAPPASGPKPQPPSNIKYRTWKIKGSLKVRKSLFLHRKNNVVSIPDFAQEASRRVAYFQPREKFERRLSLILCAKRCLWDSHDKTETPLNKNVIDTVARRIFNSLLLCGPKFKYSTLRKQKYLEIRSHILDF